MNPIIRQALWVLLTTVLACAEPKALFDGQSFAGWEGDSGKVWRVAEGAIEAGSLEKPQEKNNFLATVKSYGDFDLSLQWKLEGTKGFVNGGVQFRSERIPNNYEMKGFQADLGAGYDGCLYDESRRNKVLARPDAATQKLAMKPLGEWNDYRIRAEGPRIRLWLNGTLTVDYSEPDSTLPRTGKIALQIHGNATSLVRYRNLMLEELGAVAPKPAATLPPAIERLAPSRKQREQLAPLNESRFGFTQDEVVVFTGSENMVTEQRNGGLETQLTSFAKELSPKFRHMCWEGDTVFRQNRMMEWGTWRDNLTGAGATMVVAWFGQVEALDRTRTPAEFKAAYSALLDQWTQVTPRIVLIGPAPFTRPNDPRIPDNTPLNSRLAEFNAAARDLAAERHLWFIDLTTALPASAEPLMRDGMHFTEAGSRKVGEAIARALQASGPDQPTLRAAVVEKNRLWFDTWRCMNWAFAYGDRTTQPFAKSTADRPSFVDELKKHLPLLDHADATIQAVGRGQPAPAPLPPAPQRADPAALSPDEEKAGFKLRAGFNISLFADEKLGVIRPVQIRWDERGRLWVACTPSYPQLQPGEHGHDYILILEDTDGDGRADKVTRFAEGLTLPMGFEFAPEDVGGGLYVLESTQLVHLPDRNHDDHVDSRTVILSGFGTGDTHQDANSLRWGPDGALWFTQGYHIWSYVETPHGLAELNRSGVWRFNPRTHQLNSFLNENAAGLNCWGTAWDAYGQTFHASGADTMLWHTTPALVPTLHPLPLPTMLAQSRGKSMEPEFLDSGQLPDEYRGVLMKSTYFTSQVQLYRLRDQGSSFASDDLGDLIAGGKEFRPVEARVGPDGAIYIADWLNPVIGHYQASYRDPRRDLSHGRIWRMTAEARPLMPKLDVSKLAAPELFALLAAPERWIREQAKARLYRLPKKEVIAAYQRLETTHAEPAMLYALSGVAAAHELGEDSAYAARLSRHPDFRWRAWGTHLLGTNCPPNKATLELLKTAIKDPHPRVRLEAIVACGWQAGQGAEAMQVALQALAQPMDPAMLHALTLTTFALAPEWKVALQQGNLDLTGIPGALSTLLITANDPALLAYVRKSAAEAIDVNQRNALWAILVELGLPADTLVALQQSREAPQVLAALERKALLKPKENFTTALAQLLRSGPSAVKTGLNIVAHTRQEHGQTKPLDAMLANPQLSSELRGTLLKALARSRGKPFAPTLRPYLEVNDVRDDALAAYLDVDPVPAAKASAGRLKTIRTETEAGAVLLPYLGRKEGPALLAAALKADSPGASQANLALTWMGKVGRDDQALRQALQNAAGLSENTEGFSEALIKQLVAFADQQGDAQRGAEIFRRTACLTCHKVGSEGGVIGPDLTAISRAQSKEAIVESVLWPKRQVKEGYMLTVITTKDGRTLQGYRASETQDDLTLRDFTVNALVALAKRDIATRNDAGTIMPEGLTTALSQAERADLLKYLFERK